MSMFLETSEIVELTHRKRRAAQRTMLNALGIHYKQRPDGSFAILRAHVEKVFGVSEVAAKKTAAEPNWEALNA